MAVSSRIKNFGLNAYLTLCALVFVFILFEVFFRYFYVRSDGFAFTLGHQRWMTEYWKPVNHFGYRDREYDDSDFLGRKVLFVVGDSFVAGHGIKNYKNRFPDILQDKLGDTWRVVNISQLGWQTDDEYKAIVAYPRVPNMIVLSYYVNDIENAAVQVGMKKPDLVEPPTGMMKALITRYYFINYLYWKFRRFNLGKISQTYWEWLKKCYADEKVWQEHEHQLLQIVEYSKIHNVKLIVILFPNLRNIDESKALLTKVDHFMAVKKINFLDLSKRISEKEGEDFTVNSSDGHPNELLHRKVAELLFDQIENNPQP